MTIPYVVHVPKKDWSGRASDMRSRLQTWEWRLRIPPKFSEVWIDFTEVSFLEPWALALFTAYGLLLREKGIKVQPQLDPASPCNVYLQAMGVEDVLATGMSTTNWDDSNQNTGLHVIKSHQDVTRFIQSATRLGSAPDESAMSAIKYGMAELGRNVVQHSLSEIGGVAIAQAFPDTRRLQVAICDCGIGVRNSLSDTYPEIRNDREALKLSLLPHVSGAIPKGMYSGSDNAGLGLFFCKEICWRSGGSLWIGSQTALIGVNRDDASAKDRTYRNIAHWPGTVVVMDLPSKGVEDFGGLLEVCRILAAEARKSSGPAGLDFLHNTDGLEGIPVVNVGDFVEDVERASEIRDRKIKPMVEQGQLVILDFHGAGFVTQSFVHALLNDVFKLNLSLLRLSFLNCTRSTEEAIRAVAAYAASYKQIRL